MFEIGCSYTREDVQNLLEVPQAQRGENWDTDYEEYQDQLYVFCNVGSVGQAGHDCQNRWDDGELIWFAKTGTHITQPLMRLITLGDTPVHVFWRQDRRPHFRYEGKARTKQVEDATPVRFRWGFPSETERHLLSASQPKPHSDVATLGDVIGPESRLFAKSEFGPLHAGWPAMSFSSRMIAADFASHFRRGQDFVLFIGTGDPASTENPNHRRKVLSLVSLEPKAPISTDQIVSPEAWAAAVAKWGRRWEWSLPATMAWELTPFLDARECMPRTYAALGNLASLGRCVPVDATELPGLLKAKILSTPLQVSDGVRRIVLMNPTDHDLRKAISQLALGIQQRIALSENQRCGHYPLRQGPNLSDLIQIIHSKWVEQDGRCPLCDRPISLKPANRLLQMSPDRIDSSAKTYEAGNLHLTHLGCNLAKSDASMGEWKEFLTHIR